MCGARDTESKLYAVDFNAKQLRSWNEKNRNRRKWKKFLTKKWIIYRSFSLRQPQLTDFPRTWSIRSWTSTLHIITPHQRVRRNLVFHSPLLRPTLPHLNLYPLVNKCPWIPCTKVLPALLISTPPISASDFEPHTKRFTRQVFVPKINPSRPRRRNLTSANIHKAVCLLSRQHPITCLWSALTTPRPPTPTPTPAHPQPHS